MDQAMDGLAMGPVRVVMKMRSGETQMLETSALLGGPEAPLSEETLLDKFRSCLSLGLNAERSVIDALADRVLNVEREADVATIVAAFPAAKQT